MLLARGGLRVLVIEAARRGTDTLSTHALMRGGVLQLHRWGLLDAVVASGTPAIRATQFSYGDDDRDGRHPPRRRDIRAARPAPNGPRRAAARRGPRGRRRDPQPGPGDAAADRRRQGARCRGDHTRDRHVLPRHRDAHRRRRWARLDGRAGRRRGVSPPRHGVGRDHLRILPRARARPLPLGVSTRGHRGRRADR